MLDSHFLVFPFLDGFGNESCLFVHVGLMMMRLGELLDGIMDRFGLGLCVRHAVLLFGVGKKPRAETKGLQAVSRPKPGRPNANQATFLAAAFGATTTLAAFRVALVAAATLASATSAACLAALFRPS